MKQVIYQSHALEIKDWGIANEIYQSLLIAPRYGPLATNKQLGDQIIKMPSSKNKNEVSEPRTQREKEKSHGCYEKRAKERSTRKRTGRGPGRWLGLPLVLAGADAVEEVVDIGADVVDVRSPDVNGAEEVAGREDVGGEDVGEGLELGRKREGDRVPIVMVVVFDDEADGLSRDLGMGIDDVAEGSGELNDPDIPLSLI